MNRRDYEEKRLFIVNDVIDFLKNEKLTNDQAVLVLKLCAQSIIAKGIDYKFNN